MIFDEEYFSSVGYTKYRNFPHFRERAKWIKANLVGSILEVGCAYGYLLYELHKIGVTAVGVDISSYVGTQLLPEISDRVLITDIADVVIEEKYDWIVSWNVLDCLDDDQHAIQVAGVLNKGSVDQLHIIQMCERENNYTDQGYFIRDYNYWRSLLPSAYLVSMTPQLVYVPRGKPRLSQIPLCGDERHISVTD